MKPPSHAAIIATILRKDFTAYSRDKLWVILSALMLVLMIVIFWLLPASVDETVAVGIAHRDLGDLAEQLTAGNVDEGINVVEFPSDDALRRSVAGEAPWREKRSSPRCRSGSPSLRTSDRQWTRGGRAG